MSAATTGLVGGPVRVAAAHMPMDIELRHLRAFVAVAEELNFTRAARRLHVVQQALSAQIQELERRVGAPLFTRTTRAVALTPAGTVLLAKARGLLAGAADAVAAVRAVAAPAEPLRVGFVAGVVFDAVGAAVRAFTERHPDVALSVRFGDLLDPTGGLGAGETDVAFVYGPFEARGLALHPLFAEPLGLAMAAAHPLAARERLTPADVVAEPTFDFPASDARWRAFWAGEAFRGGRAPVVSAQYRTLEGLVAALRAGLGVHLATEGLVVAAGGAGGGLAWRPVAGLSLEHALATRESDARPAVRAFVDEVTATLRDVSPGVRR